MLNSGLTAVVSGSFVLSPARVAFAEARREARNPAGVEAGRILGVG